MGGDQASAVGHEIECGTAAVWMEANDGSVFSREGGSAWSGCSGYRLFDAGATQSSLNGGGEPVLTIQVYPVLQLRTVSD